jgi:hypothetical protein
VAVDGAARSPAPPDSEDPLAQLAEGPIFVVGVARSGTSWVHEILRSHPLVAGLYESRLFDSGQGLAFLLSDVHWGPGAATGVSRNYTREEFAAEIRRFVARIFAKRLKPHHRYIVEKTPGHVWAMSAIAEVFPDARFIHVIRDGRDVFCSVRAARRSWAEDWNRRRPWQWWLPVWARRWKRALAEARRTGAALGDRYLEVRFEDLKRDPMRSIARLLEFCRIPYDDDLLRRLHEATDFDRIHTPDEAGFYRGGRVGDWRTHFNLVDGLVFNLVAGDELVRLGYEPTRWWRPPLRRAVRPARRRRGAGRRGA